MVIYDQNKMGRRGRRPLQIMVDFLSVGADSTSLTLRSKFAKQTLHPPVFIYPLFAGGRTPLLRQDGIVRHRAVACCRRKNKSNLAGVNPRPTTYHIILRSVYGILLPVIHKSNYRNLYIFQNFRGFSTKIRQFFCEFLLKNSTFYVIISHEKKYNALKGETK